MSATVSKLPTAATSFYTVRCRGKRWAMVLVTPSPVKRIETQLAVYADRATAEGAARAIAEATLRPFRPGRSA